MSKGARYPLETAREVARQLAGALEPVCERVAIAGSIRRGKADVGDIEIVYLPKPQADLFGEPLPEGMADGVIEHWLQRGILTKRLNERGSTAWGQEIKLAVHGASGIPVDLFRCRPGGWASYLICRTGSRVHNEAVARQAMARGMRWEPYLGLRKMSGDLVQPATEAEFYKALGWPMLEPCERGPEALLRRGLVAPCHLQERRVG